MLVDTIGNHFHDDRLGTGLVFLAMCGITRQVVAKNGKQRHARPNIEKASL
jgi:hypothetical protein